MENAMLIKKIALIGALGVLALPAMASTATLWLHTINNSSKDSTVYIAASKKCSNYIGEAGITRANGGHQDTTQLGVKGICGNLAGGDCVAQLYASDDCSGAPIGTITLDTIHMAIEKPAEMTDPNYKVTYNNQADGTTVTISNN